MGLVEFCQPCALLATVPVLSLGGSVVLILDKIVAAFFTPLGAALLLGVFALVLGMLRRRKGALVLGAAAILWLYLWATPWLSYSFRHMIEREHPARPPAELPKAPAAVVLGGGVSTAQPPRRFRPDLGNAADRVWYAAELYHAGKAPILILSGGVDARFRGVSEAASMRVFLRDLGVPDAAIVLEEESRNTRENAKRVAALLKARGIGRILLVTSALHMPRAKRLFAAEGLEVIPAATDHEAVEQEGNVRLLLPDAAALEGSVRAVKEWVASSIGR